MEQVVQALGGMLLRAAPTFILLLLLYVFLKKVFFNPLDQILRKRYEATEGAMKSARDGLAAAEAKSAEYEQALREARAEMYRAQERERQALIEENAQQVRRAREETDVRVRSARAQIQSEVETARVGLGQESGALADAIAETVLQTGAGAAR